MTQPAFATQRSRIWPFTCRTALRIHPARHLDDRYDARSVRLTDACIGLALACLMLALLVWAAPASAAAPGAPTFAAAYGAEARAAALAAQPRAAEPTVDPAGPAVTLTAPALASGPSKTARFTVSWAATPVLPSGGFDAYRVEYREPGVSYWLVWQAATTARSAAFPGEPGHAYEFRAAATKSADPAVVGPWSAVKPAAAPADDAAFKVTKTWKRTSASTAYYGKIRTASVKGATATYTFTGTKAALIAPRGRALGKVAVHVRSANGSGGWTAWRLVKTIDLYSRTAKARVATAIGTYDPAVERQVRFTVTGKKNTRSTSAKVSLDGLAVYGAPRTATWHPVNIQPSTPSVIVTDQLQFTASIDGCVDQRVEWEVVRYDRFGQAYSDGAGTITADGLYTAPALPTKTQAGDETRTYAVFARGLANPDHVYGGRTLTVTLGPPPVVTDVQPRSGPAGMPVTITGRNFTSYGAQSVVLFGGVEATVVSMTDTSISAIVPGGWQSWDTSQIMRVWVRSHGVDSSFPVDLIFTVTGIKPAPPAPWNDGINAYSYDDDNASPGDVVRLLGYGFSPRPEENVVRFSGGVTAVASAYVPDGYITHLGTIHVTVPEGAQTGELICRRLDGDERWATSGPVLEVKPATVVSAGLHPSYNGYVTGPLLARNGTWGEEEWTLQGANFTKLRVANYSTTTTGVFWLDMRRNGQTYSRIMRAVSDTKAVSHRSWGPQESMPDEVFGAAQGGDTVEIRIRGDELTNRYERSSPWVPVTVGERPVWGAYHWLPVNDLSAYWNDGRRVARGDWLRLYRNGGPATQVLTCPGLWPGELHLGTDGTNVKLVRLTQNGTYTLTNHTTGASKTFVVADIGSFAWVSYGGYQYEGAHTEGVLLWNAGARLDVPPGALWSGDLPAHQPYFVVNLDHDPSDRIAFDPTLTDGGRSFTLYISPEPTRLLKPITLTLPYEPDGRAGTPYLGMWDLSSQLYYDYGLSAGQIDTTNRTMTLVLPAGDYSVPQGGALTSGALTSGARSALQSEPADESLASGDGPAASTVRIPAGFGLPNLPFNRLVKLVGAVSSSRATSAGGYVWHPPDHPTWGIRVDAVTDPDSSSYVPPEKAQRVLDIAAETWLNLAGKGWREPEAMISISVRDYGDPGVYQGATTKGVFGQPWVYVNSRLSMGKRMDTAVSHEMGHVFQRQLTTNISTKWIDEAVAEWVAWDTLGTRCDLKASFEAGCDFPSAAFPTGFWSGYTTEQAYGAGAFIIWLADNYGPAAVLDIYDTLAFRPTYWYDAHATFREATGQTVPKLVADFATAFWLQTYEPVMPLTFWSRGYGQITGYTGATVNHTMPADSSRGSSVSILVDFRPTLKDKPMVARAPTIPAGATVDVYADTGAWANPPAFPVKLGTLSSLSPVIDLGSFDDSIGCYRLVAVTPAGAGLSAPVTIEAVHLASVSPAGGSKAGGYNVTLEGCGFGDLKGTVMVGAAVASGEAITKWTDTEIRFTMPNMGGMVGPQAVQVQPVVGGASNTRPFTTT